MPSADARRWLLVFAAAIGFGCSDGGSADPDAPDAPDASGDVAQDGSRVDTADAVAPSDAGLDVALSDAGPDVARDGAPTDGPSDAGPPGLLYGANIHSGGGSAAASQKIADLLHARNLTTVRMDFGTGADPLPWRDQVTRLRAYGIKAETTLFTTYQYDKSCSLDLTKTQKDAYTQTVAMVEAIDDLVTDYELMNEVSLRPELQAEVPTNSKAPASAYSGKPCYAVKAAVLVGMYQAIRDTAKKSGLPLRIIAGTVGRDWGYLDFLRLQGIDFDVVGYHIYPSFPQAAWDTDTWYGPSGLFTELGRYARPVRINEFHCGEIYDPAFENKTGGKLTEQCFKSVTRYLFEILAEKRAPIESVHFYEMFDEPTKTAPENHFGIWYDPSSAKVSAWLASAFAGGTLSASEQAELTSRGLLTDAQILAFRK